MLTRSDTMESPSCVRNYRRIEKLKAGLEQEHETSAESWSLPPETLNLICGHLGKRDLFHCMLTNRRFANAAAPHLWRTREATSDEALEECLRTLRLIPSESDANDLKMVDASSSVSFTTDTSKEPAEENINRVANFGLDTPSDTPQPQSTDIEMDTPMDYCNSERQPSLTPPSSFLIPTESCSPTIENRGNQRPMFDYVSYFTELDASENVSAGRTTPRMLCRFLSIAGRNLKSLRLGVYLGQGKADTIALYCPNLTSLDLSRTFDPSGHEEATAYISHLLVEPAPELEHLSLLGLPLAAHVLGLACRAFPNLREFAFGPPTDPDGEYGPLAETIPPRLYRLHARVPLPLRSDFLPHLGRRCPNLRELTFEENARGNIPPYAWVHHCEATHIAVTGCATAFLRLRRISIYLSVLDLEAVLGRLSASCPNLEAVDLRVGVAIKDYFKRPSHFFSKLREITYTFEPASAPGLNQVLLHCAGLKQLTLATVGHGFDTDPEPRDETMFNDEQRLNTRVSSLDDGLGKYDGAESSRSSMRSGGSGLVTEMDLIHGTHRMNHAGSGFGGGMINTFSNAGASSPSTPISTVRQLMDRAPSLPPGWSARIVSTCKPSLRELRLRNCSGVTLFDLVCICRCTKLRRIEASRIWMPSSDATALAESPNHVDWIRRHVSRAGNGTWPPTIVVSFLVTGTKIQQLAALSLSLPLPSSTVPPPPPPITSVAVPLVLPDSILLTESTDWEGMYASASSDDEAERFPPISDGSLSSSSSSLASIPAHFNPHAPPPASSKRNKDESKRRGKDSNASGEGSSSKTGPRTARTGMPAPILPPSLPNGTGVRSNQKASQQQQQHPQPPLQQKQPTQQQQQQQHKYHAVNRNKSD